MSLRRSSSRRPRPGRVLLAGGLAVGLLLVPGTAVAADDDPPAGPLGELSALVDDALGGATGTPAAPDGSAGPAAAGEGDRGGEGEEGGTPGLDPAQLEAAVAEVTAALPLPEGCADGVQAALERLVTDLTELDPGQLADPQTLEDLLSRLEEGLTGLQAGEPPALAELDPAEFGLPDLAGAVEELVAALEVCLTPPETDEEPPPAGDDPVPPAAEPPAGEGPDAMPQPVSYPGYAPTGATATAESPGSGALAALGVALLLLGGAGAAGSLMRSRAARGEG